MLSTKIIDLVYEIVNIINNSKTNPYRCFCNDGNFYVEVSTVQLMVFNRDNDELFSVHYNRTKKISVYLSTHRHTLVDFWLVHDIECRSSYKHYDVKDLINLSTEERFYHEINSSTSINMVLDFNDYISSTGHRGILGMTYLKDTDVDTLYEILLEYKGKIN